MARKKRTWYNGACYHVMEEEIAGVLSLNRRMCRTIRETDLITAICVQMDWEQFDEGRFEAEIEKVVVTNDEITLMRQLILVTA